MSAVPVHHGDTLERLLNDQEASDRALSERIGTMLRPLARPGVSLHFTVQVGAEGVSVKIEPPPRRWPAQGSGPRRQP